MERNVEADRRARTVVAKCTYVTVTMPGFASLRSLLIEVFHQWIPHITDVARQIHKTHTTTDKSIEKHPSAGSKRQRKKRGKGGRGSVVRGETLNTQWCVFLSAGCLMKLLSISLSHRFFHALFLSHLNNRVFRSLPGGKGSAPRTEVEVESQVCMYVVRCDVMIGLIGLISAVAVIVIQRCLTDLSFSSLAPTDQPPHRSTRSSPSMRGSSR